MVKKLITIIIVSIVLTGILPVNAAKSTISPDKKEYSGTVGHIIKIDYRADSDVDVVIHFNSNYLTLVDTHRYYTRRYVRFKVVSPGTTKVILVNKNNEKDAKTVTIKCNEDIVAKEVAKVKKATAGMTDKQKIKYIHDYICKNVTYDYDTYNGTKKANDESYSAIGAIKNHKAVCMGYADCFDQLATGSGLECKIIWSDKHAWNLIKYNGKWYNIDVTWDDVDGNNRISYIWAMKNISDFTRNNITEEVGNTTYIWSDKSNKIDHTPIEGWPSYNMAKKSLNMQKW